MYCLNMEAVPKIYEFNLDLDDSISSDVNWLTITDTVHGSGKFVRQSSCFFHYAHLEIILLPYQGNTHFLLEWQVTEEMILAEFIPGVIDGIKSAVVQEDRIIINIKIQVIGGSYHPFESRRLSFHIAARKAFDDAISKTQLVNCEFF